MNLVRIPAVVQDVGVVASGALKCVGKDRHLVEGTLFVDVFSKPNDGGRQPRGFTGDGAEGIAENISHKMRLRLVFRVGDPASMGCFLGIYVLT